MRLLSDEEVAGLAVVGIRGPGPFQARYMFWDGETRHVWAKGATWAEVDVGTLDSQLGRWPMYLLEPGENVDGVIYIVFATSALGTPPASKSDHEPT
jgi:hypothetical protein